MIYIKKFKRLLPEESFVLTDFDRTLTAYDSSTSWGLLEESPYVNPNYMKASLDLYHYYRPIEIDQTIPFDKKSELMEVWFRDIAALLNKYHIYQSTIDKIFANPNGLKLRKDTPKFLKRMYELGIPVIIVSAGIGDFIERYLTKEGCMYDNMSIHSNFLIYDEDRIVGVKEPIIHSLNKGILDYPEIEGKRRGLLFGDQIEDITMGEKLDTINIGFCDTSIHNQQEFEREFDVVCTEESSFEAIGKVYIKRYKDEIL